MTAVPSERALGTAVAALLEGVIGANRADYGRVPAGVGRQGSAFLAYAVVYPGGGSQLEGTAAAPNADAAQIVQVTYVDVDANAVDEVRDACRAALLTGPGSTPLTVTGRALMGPVLLEQSLTAREDTTEPAPGRPWFAIDLYRIDTTPA